jgi:predicted DNA-binding transcriptional regulator YafY
MDKTDSSTAMLLLLAESFLKKVAPKDLLENARWLFDAANNQLEANKKVKNWRKRIYFKPLQDEFKGIKPEDELTIYQALQQDEPLKIIYHSQQHDEEREYRAYPVKIVIEPHCRLLILENPTYKDTITFLFHRIKHAEIIKNFNDFPDRVNLNLDKIEQELPKHTESMFSRQQLDLTLQVAQHERYIIEDAPVFANYEKSQVSIEDDEVEFSISKVFVSYSVLNYLIAHADSIYVAEPEELRDRVVEHLERGLYRYGCFEY